MDRLSKSLYGWGTVFALGHYLFGPPVCSLFSLYSVLIELDVWVWYLGLN